MPEVRFNLRPTKTKGSSIQLIYRIAGDNKKAVVATSLFVDPKYWNKAKMRLRANAPNRVIHNALLNKWESCANDIITEAALNGNHHSVHSFTKELKQKFKGEDNKTESDEVVKYFSDFIGLKIKEGRSKATIQNYNTSLKHFKSFISNKYNNKRIEFQDCNEKFILNFINYLRKNKNFSAETIDKVLKDFQAMMNHATKKGTNSIRDYQLNSCKVSFISQPKFYLNESEIQSIRDLELKKGTKLYKTRSMFLVGYNTGQRISDFKQFKKEHIISENGRNYIHKRTQKVGKYLKIPVNKELQKLLTEYDGFPKFISNQKFNQNLKELCKKAGIDTLVPRNEGGKQVMKPKHKLVGSHVCRRSFATNMYKLKPDPYTIMKITGHTTVKQLLNYICKDENEVATIASEHPFFK